MSGPRRFEVLVVGAGAAGLAAAVELARAGRSVCVLEARDRLGGRIFTRREPDLAVPIELGAEFVHGTPAATLDWIGRSPTVLIDAAGERFVLRGSRLEPAESLFGALEQGLAAVPRPGRDLPLAAFLEGPARKHLSPAVRTFARLLVEGFDAADASRASTFAILEEWRGASGVDAPTFRPRDGYGVLIGALAAALDPPLVEIAQDTVVHTLSWRRGEVDVAAVRAGREWRARARQVIVALPLGVLARGGRAAGGVRFVPDLGAKRAALRGLAAGPVLKVVLRFGERFWETLDAGRYREAAFFHAAEAAFPTYWTGLPVRAPLLTAWAAGPYAARLARRSAAASIRLAVDGLESLFRRGRVPPPMAAYAHDWQRDPFARGAYSYVTVGGAGTARRLLAAPLEQTLYFAGEAAAVDGESGTVAGALESGRRAARQALDASG